ncbi:hypothetical protein ACOBR2_19075 [Telmatobacter bradus]|jgi:hypothetical protein|uniref:hypothetical protein n=1 Tax=Telmatobacter bradus TaxID=474953 RepID=UPI003B43318F
MPRIHSDRVVLLEGDADEIVPNAKLAANMHGFVIVVPPGEGGERLLDMLWRITMAYAGLPRLLTSRPTVRKMVEAVWSKESREPKPASRPARAAGLANSTQRDQKASILKGSAPAPNAKLRRAIASLPPPRGGRKAKAQK